MKEGREKQKENQPRLHPSPTATVSQYIILFHPSVCITLSSHNFLPIFPALSLKMSCYFFLLLFNSRPAPLPSSQQPTLNRYVSSLSFYVYLFTCFFSSSLFCCFLSYFLRVFGIYVIKYVSSQLDCRNSYYIEYTQVYLPTSTSFGILTISAWFYSQG